jgi:Na+/citrate or Na+/malate symporter
LPARTPVRTVWTMNRNLLFSVVIGLVVGAVVGLLILEGIGPIVGAIFGGCLGYAFHLVAKKDKRSP